MNFKLFKSTCDGATTDTIAGVLTRDTPLEIYNFLDQFNGLESGDICGTPDATMRWKRNVSEDYINCCNANKMESNFFMDMFSGTPKQIETTDYHQRFRSHEDENILSKSAGLNAAGLTQRFQLDKSSHSGNGTASPMFEGMMLFNYTTNQTLKVTDINTSTPYAFIIEVASTTTDNAVIAAGDKMMRIPAVMVGGYTCPVGETTMNTHFTTKRINKMRLAKHWKMNLDVDKPYADEFLFAPWIDKNGNEHVKALPTLKRRAMEEITQAANLLLFIGNTVTNPAITTTWDGGEGLLASIRGAGKEWEYDPSMGFSLLNDFKQIILAEDGEKSTTEWMIMGSLNFLASMTEQARIDTNNEVLPLDFGTVRRTGISQQEIEKYSITSFKYLNRKVMFKEWSQLNKTKGIGNNYFPDLGIMLAMNGLTNSKGETVPPMQFYRSASAKHGIWEDLEEIDRDNRMITGCESIEGDIRKTVFWIVNCPDSHYLIDPNYCN